jgi:hypothetical protein
MVIYFDTNLRVIIVPFSNRIKFNYFRKNGWSVHPNSRVCVRQFTNLPLPVSDDAGSRLAGGLSNLDDVAVRITDVAADLAVLGDWLGDELGAATFP